MMAQKHLHELLKEDQEPFLLNKYISDRRSQIKRPSPKTSLQVKKRKQINQIPKSNFPVNLCKNTCLFSFPETPDLRKSPLLELPSPVKSPCKSPNTIFLHIPSRTASILLEAALRIQKHSSSSPKTKNQTKTRGFGLFGSLFKRLTQRNQNRKSEIEDGKVSVKDNNLVNVSEVGFLCSYNGRPSSAVWSESNEDKSLDMETSSSGHSYESEAIIHFVTNHHEECSCCHHGFCESPFRFVLQTSPCSGSHTPELASPSRHKTEEKESNEAERAESLNQFKSGEEEEEDKEQCSPVCVLDPPFEDEDEDDDEGHGNDDEGDDGFDLESSYAIVQRARQQILYKLRRFEKLAELDPVELEKRMLDQEEDEDETFMEEDGCEDEDREASCKENDFTEQVFEAVFLSSIQDKLQIPQEFKKLISDLIVEEEIELNCLEEDRDMVVSRICKRLELWKDVESNTIDMMIEEDFSREDVGWKKNVEQISKMAGELELAIFGFLVEEFSKELVC